MSGRGQVYEWSDILSGAPHGSVLGPILLQAAQ